MNPPRPGRSNLARGYPIAVASAAVLSLTAIFIRYLTQTYHLPALVLSLWRDFFVSLSLLVVLGLRHPLLLKVRRPQFLFLVGYGFLLAIFNTLWTLSVSLNGAAVATVLAYCSTGFTVLLGWWLLREQLNWSRLLAVVLSLGGCVLVAGALDPRVWNANLIGILTGVLAGLAYAVYSLMGRSASQRGLNPWTTLLYTFIFGAAFLLLFNLLPASLIPGVTVVPEKLLWLGNAAAGWGILFLLAIGPTMIGFGLYNVSLGYLPSGIANLIVSMEPAFTAVIAYIFLGERLTGIQIVGGLLILSAVVLLRVYEGWLAGRERPAADAVLESSTR
jgi:drug/metabolite transporter (DMT)-like permease